MENETCGTNTAIQYQLKLISTRLIGSMCFHWKQLHQWERNGHFYCHSYSFLSRDFKERHIFIVSLEILDKFSLLFLRNMVVETCQRVCELCPGEKIGSFVAVDYVLFALVLVVSALIGVFYMIKEYRAAKQMTSDDVLMGGRDIGIFPIAMSLMASFMGAITVLGTPTEMYNNNTSYWLAGMAMLITVPLTNHIFLPFFHDLSLTSAYEVSQWLFVHTWTPF